MTKPKTAMPASNTEPISEIDEINKLLLPFFSDHKLTFIRWLLEAEIELDLKAVAYFVDSNKPIPETLTDKIARLQELYEFSPEQLVNADVSFLAPVSKSTVPQLRRIYRENLGDVKKALLRLWAIDRELKQTEKNLRVTKE